MKRIGIDVGGTNTDAALLDGATVLAAVKTFTTADVTSGVGMALADLIAKVGDQARDVSAVMIGTTHFTNAVVERRNLGRAAATRMSLPASASLKPFCDWPKDLAAKVDGGASTSSRADTNTTAGRWCPRTNAPWPRRRGRSAATG